MGNQQQFGGGFGAPMQQKLPTDQHDFEVTGFNFPDTISQVKFSPQNSTYQQFGQLLAVTCWDGTIAIWKVLQNANKTANFQPMVTQSVGVPILGMSWQIDSPALLLACSDNSIKKWDLAGN